MAILKTANTVGKYYDVNAKQDVINYILKPNKMIHRYFGSIGVDQVHIAESMQRVSERFSKAKGVQLRHFILSFYPEELHDPRTANEIGAKIIQWFGQEYQSVYSVHEDKSYLHIHIVINSVSYIDGHRYYGTKKEFYEFKNVIRRLLSSYGIYRLEYCSNR